MKTIYFSLAWLLVLVSISCTGERQQLKVQALSLSYSETEQGIDPYPVRMLITDQFLRLDDGEASEDYLLFNRQEKAIYSVTPEDKSVLKIPFREIKLNKQSGPLVTAVKNTAGDLPKFMDKDATHHSLRVGGRQCYDVVAVEGLYPDAVLAMREYLLTLAGEQAVNINKTPVEMREPCMLSNLVFSPLKHLDYGFPLREWDYRGYIRELKDIESITVSSTLFEINPDFQVLTMNSEGWALENSQQ